MVSIGWERDSSELGDLKRAGALIWELLNEALEK